MLILSAKARRMIDAAVAWYIDVPRQQVWFAWSTMHPTAGTLDVMVDTPEQTFLPKDVVEIILAALDTDILEMEEMRQLAGMSEDSISDLDNDITYCNLIKRNIQENIETDEKSG
jgi:hypothetical protein